eukprot:gb/GECG01000045.1/.p1 GENE.gb/GECG01000045.1/~~gb/GECG01000045.1/.p1  ORF type:complete len:541 (+),score=85.55 gb/GECG01000045.1/:1-1623(+)
MTRALLVILGTLCVTNWGLLEASGSLPEAMQEPHYTSLEEEYADTFARALRGMPHDSMGRTKTEQEKEETKKVFPQMFTFKRLLARWSPDIPYVPPEEVGGGTKFDSLERLDYQDPAQKQRARLLRKNEVPFKVYNVPNVNEVVKKWKSDEHMSQNMGSQKYGIGAGYHNHFMFFRPSQKLANAAGTTTARAGIKSWNKDAGTGVRSGNFKTSLRPPKSDNPFEAAVRKTGYTFAYPPPSTELMTFDEWREMVRSTERKIEESARKFDENPKAPISPDNPYDGAGLMHSRFKKGQWPYANFSEAPLAHTFPHYYLTFGDNPQGGSKAPGKDIEIWRKWDDFFIVDANDIRGIHCRFGMKGVVAEGHWDGHLNFIAILGGQKRYILLPPSECRHAGIMSSGPSKRHFQYDYSDPETVFANDISSRHAENARAVETVLKEGEVLYVPGYWMHYIVSLHDDNQKDPAVNYQCNARSGTSPMSYEDKLTINECLGEEQQAPDERWWETSQNWKAEEEQQGLQELSKLAEQVREDLRHQSLGGTA